MQPRPNDTISSVGLFGNPQIRILYRLVSVALGIDLSFTLSSSKDCTPMPPNSLVNLKSDVSTQPSIPGGHTAGNSLFLTIVPDTHRGKRQGGSSAKPPRPKKYPCPQCGLLFDRPCSVKTVSPRSSRLTEPESQKSAEARLQPYGGETYVVPNMSRIILHSALHSYSS